MIHAPNPQNPYTLKKIWAGTLYQSKTRLQATRTTYRMSVNMDIHNYIYPGKSGSNILVVF